MRILLQWQLATTTTTTTTFYYYYYIQHPSTQPLFGLAGWHLELDVAISETLRSGSSETCEQICVRTTGTWCLEMQCRSTLVDQLVQRVEAVGSEKELALWRASDAVVLDLLGFQHRDGVATGLRRAEANQKHTNGIALSFALEQSAFGLGRRKLAVKVWCLESQVYAIHETWLVQWAEPIKQIGILCQPNLAIFLIDKVDL
jgi:hypothetical protein